MPVLFSRSSGEAASGPAKIRNWQPPMQVHSVTAARNCCTVPQLQVHQQHRISTTIYVISYSVIYIRNITYIAHEPAICRNPHNLSNWDSRISLHLGYKHTFCQNVVSPKKCLSLNFRKNITSVSVGLFRISQIFPVSCKIVCRWVMTNCCFMSDI
jgi:hypothetical protein